jgi:hypothetical protein
MLEQPPPKGMKLLELVPPFLQGAQSYPPASCRNTLPASWQPARRAFGRVLL